MLVGQAGTSCVKSKRNLNYKAWHENKTKHNSEKYNRPEKNAKRGVADAKARAFEELYQKFGTGEEETEIFQTTKARDNA